MPTSCVKGINYRRKRKEKITHWNGQTLNSRWPINMLWWFIVLKESEQQSAIKLVVIWQTVVYIPPSKVNFDISVLMGCLTQTLCHFQEFSQAPFTHSLSITRFICCSNTPKLNDCISNYHKLDNAPANSELIHYYLSFLKILSLNTIIN